MSTSLSPERARFLDHIASENKKKVALRSSTDISTCVQWRPHGMTDKEILALPGPVQRLLTVSIADTTLLEKADTLFDAYMDLVKHGRSEEVGLFALVSMPRIMCYLKEVNRSVQTL